jgi:hypothetical protein
MISSWLNELSFLSSFEPKIFFSFILFLNEAEGLPMTASKIVQYGGLRWLNKPWKFTQKSVLPKNILYPNFRKQSLAF